MPSENHFRAIDALIFAHCSRLVDLQSGIWPLNFVEIQCERAAISALLEAQAEIAGLPPEGQESRVSAVADLIAALAWTKYRVQFYCQGGLWRWRRSLDYGIEFGITHAVSSRGYETPAECVVAAWRLFAPTAKRAPFVFQPISA